jgi:nucleoside-diphosphate-sugar epimerase
MRILVIGGTRFIGLAAVRQLAQQGHDIAVFHRGQTNSDLPSTVQSIHSDTDHKSSNMSPHFTPAAIEAFRRFAPDVVLHMLLFGEQDARDAVETFKGMARRLVMISSQDVYRAFGRLNGVEGGSPDPLPIAEDAPLRENHYYYRANPPRSQDDPEHWMDHYDKTLAEQIVMSEPDLPYTILRLPAVYGPGDYQHRHFSYVKRMDDQRPAILLDEAEAKWRWTYGYIDDVATAIALVVTDERAKGRIYNVAEEATLSLEERVRLVARIAGWQGRIVKVPQGRLPEALKWNVNTEQEMVVDSSRIRKELGFKESLSLEEAMRRTVAWELAHPPIKIDPKDFDYTAEDAILNDMYHQ